MHAVDHFHENGLHYIKGHQAARAAASAATCKFENE